MTAPSPPTQTRPPPPPPEYGDSGSENRSRRSVAEHLRRAGRSGGGKDGSRHRPVQTLHFILLVREGEEEKRRSEFEYVQGVALFFRDWIRRVFSREVRVRADVMTTRPRGLFQRLDTHHLVDDHRSRGPDTYHFYLANFRPFWTDCTCEGYHAENFGMVWWRAPENPGGDDGDTVSFLAEKNCTTISHEIAHEMLRQAGVKKYIEIVHDVWTKHFHAGLAFAAYDRSFERIREGEGKGEKDGGGNDDAAAAAAARDDMQDDDGKNNPVPAFLTLDPDVLYDEMAMRSKG